MRMMKSLVALMAVLSMFVSVAHASGVSNVTSTGMQVYVSAQFSGPDHYATLYIVQTSGISGTTSADNGSVTGPALTPQAPSAMMYLSFYNYATSIYCSSSKSLGATDFISDGETAANLSTTLSAADGSCIGDLTLEWTSQRTMPERQNWETVSVNPIGSTIVTSVSHGIYTSSTASTNGTILGKAVSGGCYYYYYCLARNIGTATVTTTTS